ncbi:hypothetical protein [Nannocystis pusilla]|uniref:hypothetical protein n=1 Tax=Nannocystis pusilla TaxID=889268 RepID=UPI003B7F03FB
MPLPWCSPKLASTEATGWPSRAGSGRLTSLRTLPKVVGAAALTSGVLAGSAALASVLTSALASGSAFCGPVGCEQPITANPHAHV